MQLLPKFLKDRSPSAPADAGQPPAVPETELPPATVEALSSAVETPAPPAISPPATVETLQVPAPQAIAVPQKAPLPRRKAKNRSRFLIGLMAAAILAGGGATYFFMGQSKPKLDIDNLTVPVRSQTLKLRISASGTVVPVQSVNLSPKTSGRLAQLYVEQGDRVQQGQKIGVMESRELQAQLNQAKAKYDEAQARLAEAQRGSRKEEIAQSKARLEQAEARLKEARTGGSEEIDQARSRLAQAQARLKEARTSRPEEIDQARARLAQTKARLAAAISGRPEQIAQAQAQVNAARARVSLAQQRVRSNESLAQQGAISRDKLAEVKAEGTSAEANLEEAQRRLDQLNNSTRQDVDRERATVAEAEFALQQVQKGKRSEEIVQLQAAVAEAKFALQQVQRGKRPEEIQQLEGVVAEAKAAYQLLLNGTRPEQIALQKAAVQGARASLQAVQIQLDDAVVRAPFSGIVTQKYANVGAFVTPTTSASSTNSATSTSIVAIAKDLEIKAKVPEVDIGQIKPGQPIEIVADAYPDKVFKGSVRLVAPEAIVEQNVTSFEVRLAIETGKELLRSGMNVNVTFLGKELQNALMVPTVAIVTEEGKTGVYVTGENNKPAFRSVKIGSSIEDKTQILEGIKAGDRVFLEIPKDGKPKGDRERKRAENRALRTGARAAGIRTR